MTSRIIEEMLEETKKEVALGFAKRMLKDGLEVEKIAKYCGLEADEIEKLRLQEAKSER